MLIWRIGQQEPLFVRVTIVPNSIGVFALERYLPSGASVPIGTRIDAGGIDDDAIFEIAPADFAGVQYLSMQVRATAGNPAMQAMQGYQTVYQSGGALTPEDAQGNVLPTQANGVRLVPDLASNQPGFWPFQVNFQ